MIPTGLFDYFRKLEDLQTEKAGISQALSSKEADVQQIQQQLEEKTRECSILSRQLQQTLDDAQRQVLNLRIESLLLAVHQCAQTLGICSLFFISLIWLVFFQRSHSLKALPGFQYFHPLISQLGGQ